LRPRIFLSQHGGVAPSDALYVVEGGGENARDALAAIGDCGGNPFCVSGVIQSTAADLVGDIGTIDSKLEGAGAKNIVVWNVPDIGKTPAILASGALASRNAPLLAYSSGDPGSEHFRVTAPNPLPFSLPRRMKPEPTTGIRGSALLRSVVTNIGRSAKPTASTQL
jgi:hypothetical protein